MNGNPHFKSAAHPMGAGKMLAHQAAYEIGKRQSEATLALAFEQRTANLIETLRVGEVDMTGWPQLVCDNFHRTSQEIAERLGLSEEGSIV